MTRRKLLAAPVLLLLAMAIVTGAEAATILGNANQITQIISPASNSGSFTISSMQIVAYDGSLQPIPPRSEWPDKVFIATRVTWHFIATDPNFNGQVDFNLGDYYRATIQVVNGFGSAMDGIVPGAPMTNLSPTVFLHLSADPLKIPLSGKLNLRVIGYLANIN